jgi:hypothetical protein
MLFELIARNSELVEQNLQATTSAC